MPSNYIAYIIIPFGQQHRVRSSPLRLGCLLSSFGVGPAFSCGGHGTFFLLLPRSWAYHREEWWYHTPNLLLEEKYNFPSFLVLYLAFSNVSVCFFVFFFNRSMQACRYRSMQFVRHNCFTFVWWMEPWSRTFFIDSPVAVKTPFLNHLPPLRTFNLARSLGFLSILHRTNTSLNAEQTAAFSLSGLAIVWKGGLNDNTCLAQSWITNTISYVFWVSGLLYTLQCFHCLE